MNDSPSLFLIKVEDFLSEILCSLWFYMSLPSARIEEEGLVRSVAPPRLRPGLLSLCSVTSFRRFPVSFPHKSRRLSF